MNYAVIKEGVVVNIALADEPLADNWVPLGGGAIGDTYADGVFIKPEASTGRDAFIAGVQAAVQARLDEFASERGYNSILSACSYAASPNARFSSDGKYCAEARDATWDKCFSLLDDYDAGLLPGTTEAEVIAQLPPLNWPT